nr:class I SAM-dependent methyltransferase [Okeania sp. SIO1F9]
MGCGTGFISGLLQGNFEYIGIDISANMLDYAAQKGGYKNTEFSFLLLHWI